MATAANVALRSTLNAARTSRKHCQRLVASSQQKSYASASSASPSTPAPRHALSPSTSTATSTSRGKQAAALASDLLSEADQTNLYALTAVPPLSAYSALAHRLIAGLPSTPATLAFAENLELIEKCCTCPSFWTALQANKRFLVNVWVDRVGVKPGSYEGPFTNALDEARRHNRDLATLGNELLGMFATEWLEHRWPHLPSKFVFFTEVSAQYMLT